MPRTLPATAAVKLRGHTESVTCMSWKPEKEVLVEPCTPKDGLRGSRIPRTWASACTAIKTVDYCGTLD